MPRSGVSTKQLQAIEDEIAVHLDGRDGLRELWLFLRREERRGKLDPADAAAAQRDLQRALRSVERALAKAQAERAGRR